MVERFRQLLLGYLKVPPEPEPPWGAPESIRVFRAGANFYKLKLFAWMAKQAAAMVGLGFSIFVLHLVASGTIQSSASTTSAARNSSPQTSTASISTNAVPGAPPASPQPSKGRRRGGSAADAAPVREIVLHFVKAATPERVRWVMLILTLAEVAGVVFFCFQAAVSYVVLRLDYEMRWYIVTDRSLRIRSGILRVQELTMSFANLQQVILSQGPLQRWLGIADVKVESAGGGSSPAHQDGIEESLHTGFFHGVDNAAEVRDLILARLKRFREAGLGDPDDVHPTPPALPATPQQTEDAVAAARELLAELRRLRGSLAGTQGPGAG
jgi:membrane protein YdbS with pleckstrin-like domain